jgi:Flp pilus assembly protein TadD
MRPWMFTALLLVGCSIRPMSAAAQQRNPLLLIISQPESKADKADAASFVNLAPHLEAPLKETGRYDVAIYRSNHPLVEEGLKSKALVPMDLIDPTSVESSHKIAKAIGAHYILKVSALYTKSGVTAKADMEYLVGQNSWSTVLTDRMDAPKASQGKKSTLLEAVHIHVETLVKHINAVATGSIIPQNSAAAQDPLKTNGAAGPNTGEKTAGPSGIGTPGAGQANSQPRPPTGGSTAGQKNPSSISTYEILVDRARRNGDLANLIVSLRKAVTEKPEDVRLRRDLIQAYRDRGWNEAARDEALRAATLAPADPAVHRLIGESILETGDAEGALKEFQEAVRLDPKDPANHVALGDAYWKAARPDDALAAYETAAKASSKSSVAVRRVAILQAQRGKFKECSESLAAAVAITSPEDMARLTPDFATVLGVAENLITDTSMRLQAIKIAFRSGMKNREEAFKEFTAQRKRAEELATFLDEMPAGGVGRIKALYGQAAGMIVQAADRALDFLEVQSTSLEDESNLLRLEAGKQIADASKRLKALLAAPPR